jgi:hypothetical protein
MKVGCTPDGKNDCITIRKGAFGMFFNKKLETPKGYLPGAEFIILDPPVSARAFVILESGNKIPIQDLHERLGHPSLEATRATATNFGIKGTGKLDVCEDCALAKGWRKPIPKKLPTRKVNLVQDCQLIFRRFAPKSMDMPKFGA